MSKIPFKKLEAKNADSDDKRGQKPDFKAKVDNTSYKKAVMGRSKKK